MDVANAGKGVMHSCKWVSITCKFHFSKICESGRYRVYIHILTVGLKALMSPNGAPLPVDLATKFGTKTS